MTSLRPMRPEEFADYKAYFIPDYAAEMAANYRLPLEQSLARAERELADDLPDGVATADHVLLCIGDGDGIDSPVIGYLWYRLKPGADAAFIMDFYVKPERQGEGHGRAALGLLEQQLAGQGIGQLQLRVAGDNSRALHLYQSCGFGITGINMSKAIQT